MPDISRREFLKSVSAAGCGSTLLGPKATLAQSKGDRRIVVVSFGGAYQAAQRKAYYQPFEAATGIKVVEDTLPTPAKLKAMVDTKNVTWDVVEVASSTAFAMSQYFEDIDYNVVSKAELLQSAVLPNATGLFFYSVVLSFNTKQYRKDGKHPKTWTEFWDVKTFPGPRVLDAGNRGWTVMEMALLADGVPKEKIYPLDMERAWRSLDRVRPHVVKWTTSFAQSMQLLVDGEAVLATNPSNRLVPARHDGAPVDFVWDQGLLDYTCWAIPKGAHNRREALQFIAFSTTAKAQAEFVKQQPGGPVNLKAFNHLTEDEAQLLATYRQNLERQLVLNPKWWAEKGSSGKTHYEDYLDRVSAWMLKS